MPDKAYEMIFGPVGGFDIPQPPEEASQEPTVTASIATSTDLTELIIQNDGVTATVTLTGDIWVASGTVFNAIRQDIIDGLFSLQGSLALGFEQEVRDNMAVTDVARTSDTVVTLTWAVRATFDPGVREEIKILVPPSAMQEATQSVQSDDSILIYQMERWVDESGAQFVDESAAVFQFAVP